MQALKIWLFDVFRPPSGRDARQVVIAFTAFLTAGRFGLTRLTSREQVARIIIPDWQFGIAFLMLLIALVLTTNGRRQSWAGFAASIFGVGMYIVQAYDVYPSFPSSGYYVLMAIVLLSDSAVILGAMRHHADI